VPAWDFTIAGTTEHLAQVAVSPQLLLTVDSVPGLTPAVENRRIFNEIAEVHATGPASVQVKILGAVQACHGGFTVEPVEEAHAFTIAVAESYDITSVCDAAAQAYPADVQLASPIGNRVLIDAATGAPVVLTR
jgi:hypothetical protein